MIPFGKEATITEHANILEKYIIDELRKTNEEIDDKIISRQTKINSERLHL